MKCIIIFLASLLVLSCAKNNHEPYESGKNQAQVWAKYLSQDNPKSPFIDFSRSGVNFSNKDIPESTLPVFLVTDYGAIANDTVEDVEGIQKTIDAAQKAGGGIVQFPPGRFLINEKRGRQQSLLVSQSNIILRGSKNKQHETELFMRYHLAPEDPKKMWTVPAMITFMPKVARPLTSNSAKRQYLFYTIITEDAPLGQNYVTVENPNEFNEGDLITFEMENIAANEEFLEGKPTREIWHRINTKGVMVAESHQIKDIVGNRIYFTQPTLTRIKANYGWKLGTVPSISNVGLENIRFTGNFTQNFSHHNNYIHDSGFSAVALIRTMHSWVKNNHFVNVSNAVTVQGGLANSVLLNSIQGNSGHGSFSVTFGTRNLIGLNIDNTNQGQWHGPNVSHLSVGNVIWKFNSPKSRGIDAHSVFPRHTLFDSIVTNDFEGWGGSYATLPNHLEGLVLWNYKRTGEYISQGQPNKKILDFWNLPKNSEEKYGSFTAVNPVIIGYQDSEADIKKLNVSFVESINEQVSPHSLFEAQLSHRLGSLPEWMKNYLSDWRKLKSTINK